MTSTFLPEGVVDKRFIGYDPTDNLQMELLGELLGIDFFIFSILGIN